MSLNFITGNENKFREAQMFIPDLTMLKIDLTEIQSLDPKVIIAAKLTEAYAHNTGELIVEDTSLHLDALNGLPGPLIKWFLETVGNEGLAKIALRDGRVAAVARTVIGYAKSETEHYFFEGMLKGTIVEPRGKSEFGWDPIFQPYGEKQTLAEMGIAAKNEISMRSVALRKLKEFFAASQ